MGPMMLFIIIMCCFLALVGTVVFIVSKPNIHFYLQSNKDFLLIQYLNTNDPIDRIIYLSDNQVKELMKIFYDFYSNEKEMDAFSDRFDNYRYVESSRLKHSIKQILYLESILKSYDNERMKTFINSQLTNKYIKSNG